MSHCRYPGLMYRARAIVRSEVPRRAVVTHMWWRNKKTGKMVKGKAIPQFDVPSRQLDERDEPRVREVYERLEREKDERLANRDQGVIGYLEIEKAKRLKKAKVAA